MTAGNTSEPTKTADGFRRILVASDLTPNADRAFDRAVILAAQNQASVRLIHSVETTGLAGTYLQAKICEAEAYLAREMRESGLDKFSDTSVNVVSGSAVSAVVQEAQFMRADLIVLGLTHDKSLVGMVRGTTIDKVVRDAVSPVLVVKTRARRPYVRIAVAIDLSQPSQTALDIVLRAYPDAEINILHVVEPTSEGPVTGDVRAALRQQVVNMVAAKFLAAGRRESDTTRRPIFHFMDGVAVNVLPEQISKLDPDLVAMGTHGRSGIANLVLGSVAQTLLDILPRDMLVVRG
ncbi:MAG: universal stress protein [Telmatospirillum sp.]|nr:universal stress protein [Telmatospirillum sp.]